MARADWSPLLGTSGFFGQYYFGGVYRNDKSFAAEVSMGSYLVEGEAGWQLNCMFRYMAMQMAWNSLQWRALGFGAGFTYALNDLKGNNYFSSSPSHFPEDYYEQTALRGILELSTEVYFSGQQIEVGYYLRLLDKGLGAYYNSKSHNLRYYTSSSLALIFHF